MTKYKYNIGNSEIETLDLSTIPPGVTYTVVTENEEQPTQEEVFNERVLTEFSYYEKRKADGQQAVLMLESKLRVLKLLGVITEESHKGIDALLEPIAIAVERGQWIDGRDKLVTLGSEQIGQDLYDAIFAQINDYIALNY